MNNSGKQVLQNLKKITTEKTIIISLSDEPLPDHLRDNPNIIIKKLYNEKRTEIE